MSKYLVGLEGVFSTSHYFEEEIMKRQQLTALLISLIMAISMFAAPVNLGAIESHGASSISAEDQLLDAMIWLHQGYIDGSVSLNSYDAYILSEAGQTIGEWEDDSNTSLTDSVESLIDESISEANNLEIKWHGGEGYKISAKRLAQDYLGALTVNNTSDAALLIDILGDRQDDTTGAIDGSIPSDVAAYEMMARAEVTSGSGLNIELAVDYLISEQNSAGDWGGGSYESGGETITYYDFISTSEAVRALIYFRSIFEGDTTAIDTAIDDGLSWIEDQQNSDGSYMQTDDFLMDAAEAVTTAIANGDHSNSWKSGSNKGPVDFLLSDTLENFLTNGKTYGGSLPKIWLIDAFNQAGYSLDNNLRTSATWLSYFSFGTGTPVNGDGYTGFDSYEIALLMESGVDIEDWIYNGQTLKDAGQLLIDATVSDASSASAKRIAQDYYLASKLNQTSDKSTLMDILETRQKTDGSLDTNIYSDAPAFDLLNRSGALSGSDLDVDLMVDYLVNQQFDSGFWGSEFMGTAYPDFMSTVQAVRVLDSLKYNTNANAGDVQKAINDGFQWLLGNQQDHGGFNSGYDDTVVDTSEIIYTAVIFEEDANDWVSSSNNSPLDFFENSSKDELLALSSNNIMTYTWMLDAAVQSGNITITPDDDGDDTAPVDTEVRVYIAVIGIDGELLYNPRRVTLEEDDEYGLTALGALDATGLDYDDSDPSYIPSIGGQDAAGRNGWMYAVDGRAPSYAAINKTLQNGDQVLWWYSSDGMGRVPEWPEESSSTGGTGGSDGSTLVADEETLKAVEDSLTDAKKVLEQAIADQSSAPQGEEVAVIKMFNEDKRMSDTQAAALAKELEDNVVEMAKEFEGEDIVIADAEAEVSMLVPGGALEGKATITAEEVASDEAPKNFGVSVQGAVYDFGPDGTKFEEPLTISIKVAIDEDTDLSKLSPAWFDESTGKWVPIPGVINLETGEVTFTIDHFTKFSVIEKEERVSFGDVSDGYAWAKDAIEILAGQGLINGTGNGYEPARSITRAEFVKVMTGAMGYEMPEEMTKSFEDVDEDNYFAPYIEMAYTNGLVTGDPEGTFRPSDSISRNEIVTILGRLEEEINVPDTYSVMLNDLGTVPEWAMEGLKFSAYNGIINGDESGNFGGGRDLTRAEAAVVIYRYLNRQ